MVAVEKGLSMQGRAVRANPCFVEGVDVPAQEQEPNSDGEHSCYSVS